MISLIFDLASDLYLDLLIFKLETLLNSCFVEQVEALKSEYNRRMAQYRLAKTSVIISKITVASNIRPAYPAEELLYWCTTKNAETVSSTGNSLFVNKRPGQPDGFPLPRPGATRCSHRYAYIPDQAAADFHFVQRP